MAQHHRLSPLARDITLALVGRMTDTELVNYFAALRWESEVQQVCPKCGALDAHYPRRRRRRSSRRPSSSWEEPTNPSWQCKHCQAIFSVTTGTLFDCTKLPLRTILYCALLFLGPGNGASAVGLSGVSGLAVSTALLLEHRFREAMAADQPPAPFQGMVQMDGAYFCGKPRKPNRRLPRVTREQLQRRFGKQPVAPTKKPWVAMGMTQQNWKKDGQQTHRAGRDRFQWRTWRRLAGDRSGGIAWRRKRVRRRPDGEGTHRTRCHRHD